MSGTPTIFDLCEPRADVRAGTAMDSDFAANLARVLRDDAPPEYANNALLYANTCSTRGLRSLLVNVCGRLSSGIPSVVAVFRLDTSFGGGKTHGLIALLHTARGLARVAAPGEFVDPALLPRGRVRGVAFTVENSDPVNRPRMSTDGPLNHTPRGEIAYDLAGPEGFARVRASDQADIAPGAETIPELFGEDPTLIFLDGLHVRSAQHAFAAPSIRWLHPRAIKAGLLATAHRHLGTQKFSGRIRSMPSWSSLTSRRHRPQPPDADQGQADPC